MLSSTRIQFKITLLLIALLVVAVTFNALWSYSSQTVQAEKEMLEKTQILNQELQAVWEFVDLNQTRIDTDADGNFNFKNIYCAIAGKSVAAILMRDTDYIVRYVSLNPRTINSKADEFETSAMEVFRAAGSEKETYRIENYKGRMVFRYTSPIYIKDSCLSCHGEPTGELDITNWPKEGLKTGDLAGAASIIMPIDLYLQGVQQNIFRQSLYFFLALSVLIVIVHFAISYLVRRLENANELLQQESKYKSDFLAIMHHELKTPLTSIIAFTEIWEKSLKDTDKREQHAVAEIKQNSHTLLEMVNNILEAARIDAGKLELHPEWVDMVDLISTVEGVIRPLADQKRITFTTKVEGDVPLIYADWEKLRRIVENLASNAVKFTKEGGSVSIDVEKGSPERLGAKKIKNKQAFKQVIDSARATTDAENIFIKVSDTGIGIKKEDVERLFQKFMQLDQSAQRRYRGSGIGLAVVKELVFAHDGKIEIDSIFKQGSTFTVHIPIGSTLDVSEEEGGKDENSSC